MAKKNEAKIKFTAETGEFNDSIKKANQEMSELRAELKLNETQMQRTGATVEGLEQKHKILSDQLQASQDKTEALNQKVNKAVEIYGENSEEVSKLRTQLLNAQTAEEKIKQSIQACNDELDAQRKASEAVEDAHESLTDKIKRQQSELDGLKNDYAELVASGKGASDEAQILARSIEDLSGELKDSKKDMSNASKMADELDKSLDEVDESAENAGDGFTVLGGTVADLASSAIQGAIGKISEFIGYLSDLPSATMELRQDLATLTTSFDNVGMSSDTAKNTWKELYAVFGEDDRAVETANHIARMADSQKDLSNWVDITTGVWATYQDSLPVEGLAEASAETAKTGKVTGGLADALNWSSEASQMFAKYMSDDVVTAEDAFNVALSECTTEQERQALITDTLTKLYGASADTYRETAGAQMEAKEATAENILAEANLATAIEPVTTKFNEMKTSILTGIMPAVEKFSGVMVSALEWMQEHPVAMRVLVAVVGTLATAFTGLAIALGIYSTAQMIANLAIAPFILPILGIVAGITALVAVIVLVISYWDEIVIAVKNAVSAIGTALQSAWDWITNLFSSLASWVDINVIQPVVSFFTGLWTKLQEIWNTIVNTIQFAFLLISSIVNGAIQIITLPFMFIWENCKEYVFQAFEWIKEKISFAIEFIKILVSVGFGLIRDYIITPIQKMYQKAVEIFNSLKSAISERITLIREVATLIFNSLKETATSIFNSIKEKIVTPIQNAKELAISAIQTLKSNVESKIQTMRNKVSEIFLSVKEKITKPIEEAKEKVKAVVDAIKGFFSNLKLEFPKIKMPHFKITGKFSLDPPSVPKLGIEWYKDGGILTKPTIFGMNGSNLMAGGEAGAEAILPIDRLEGYIAGAIEKTMQVADVQALADAIEDLANRPIMLNLNGRNFATATASDTDNVNGLRTSFKSRGLVLG